tara:strand:- start:155 stop:400 length:246 start_codon:yes stop_codon:yes gene_type:complete
MTNNPLSSQLIRATLARFEAERQDALATIELYLNAPVGVGDHPNIIAEIASATTRLAGAEEALEAFNRNFLRTPEDLEENG